MVELTIVPRAGLANRMRAIASGIQIANTLNANTTIYWIKKKECNIAFDNLFLPLDIKNVTIRPTHFLNFRVSPPARSNFYLPYFVRLFSYSKEINNFNRTKGTLIDILPRSGKIYLSSWHSMGPHYPIAELFIPKKEIQTKIDFIKSKFSSNTIGMHIRRTDHKQSIKNNSIEDFKHRIKLELSNNTKTKIYLATDSSKVKKELIDLYGDSIITYDASLNRTTEQGMQDAVVDLWCLSSTKYIIGSYYSSYSELAAELGNIKLIIL